MKKVYNRRSILIVALILTLLFTACSASPDSTKDNQGDTTVASETPVATTTEQKDTESLSTEQVNTTEAATTAQADAKKDDSEVLPEEPLKKPDNLVFGETEHKTTPVPEGNWSAEVPDFGAFYQMLTEKQDDLWKAYQDGDAEFYRYAADPESSDKSAAPLMLPELPGVGFFKGDGSETPEKAAETLIGMMLSCINEIPENDRWFTLTGYEIRDVKCYDGETVDEIAELLELGTFDSESKTYVDGLSGIRLPENVWLFDPHYTCTYTGEVMFGEEAAHPEQTVFTYDNVDSRQGMPLSCYYVLIRQGDLWRCEKSAMIPRCYLPAQTSEVLPEQPLKKPDNLVFGETEHSTTPLPEGNWSADVPDFGAFYQMLTEKQDDLWKTYQGGDAEFYRYAADQESSDQNAAPLMLPDLPGVGFYKGTGDETPEEAAEKLIGMMLSCINEIPEENRWFTLTGYEVRDVKCYDGETIGKIAELLELGTFDSESKTYVDGLSGISLPENVWLFDPHYICMYTGEVLFGEEAAHPEQTVFTYDNVASRQGMPLSWYYVLIRQGDLWRCEGYEMIPRCYLPAETTP